MSQDLFNLALPRIIHCTHFMPQQTQLHSDHCQRLGHLVGHGPRQLTHAALTVQIGNMLTQ